jgi:predicted negative regulator of RcsB-dependent stress response
MRKWILASVAAAALAGAGVAEFAFASPGDPPGGMMMGHHGPSPEVRAALFEARIQGMKAALKLTPDQEKAWAPFETAVRGAEKAHEDAQKEMRDRFEKGERASPIEHLNAMSDHLAKASTELKQVADAASPLYGSLDDTQKEEFGALLMTLREGGTGHHGGHMGPWEHHMEGGEPPR